MTDLDAMDLFSPRDADPVPTPPRHIHTYARTISEVQRWGVPIGRCRYCERTLDDATARRGKSARRLGHDQERRIERVYGPVKIGERGDPVDHIGKVWRWQSKATRELPPRWLALIDSPTAGNVTESIARPWNGMTGLYDPRRSVVIRSFVRNGGLAAGRTRDWLFIAGRDGIELGLPYDSNWYVIPGEWWLDHFGRDE